MTRLVVPWLALVALASCHTQEDEMGRSIQEVKAEHAGRLLELPGVVSVGIGRDERREEIIVIGLDRPRPETEARLPERLEEYAVRVDVIGTIEAR